MGWRRRAVGEKRRLTGCWAGPLYLHEAGYPRLQEKTFDAFPPPLKWVQIKRLRANLALLSTLAHERQPAPARGGH